MFKGKYLCGCDPNDEKLKRYAASFDSQGNLTYKRFDLAGFEVCPIHGKRMYGWASPMVQGPQGNDVIDYHRAYAEMYGTKKSKIKSNVEDIRNIPGVPTLDEIKARLAYVDSKQDEIREVEVVHSISSDEEIFQVSLSEDPLERIYEEDGA